MYYLYYLPIRNGDRKERIAATEEADLLGLISSEITLTFLALWIGVAASNLLPWAHRHISQLIADRMLE